MRTRRLNWVAYATAPALAALLVGCGHTIRADLMDNYPSDFDFRSFSCNQTSTLDEDHAGIGIRFLGVSGLYVEWNGVGLLTAPFFSRAGLFRVAFGRARWDQAAIEEGMRHVPGDSVAGILAAHSHHDHLFDVPIVARDFAGDAKIYVNRSGATMLAFDQDLERRTVVLEEVAEDWVWLTDGEGKRHPIRFLALPSPHARQAPGIRWANGEVQKPWSQPWEDTRLRRFQSGQPFAFVIDLMPSEGTEPVFRIYYQEAATIAGGLTPLRDIPALEGRPVDLAVLCIASHHLAKDFPERLLRDLEPRHVLVTHYEDFFRRRERPLRFAPLLSDRRANAFLEKVGDVVENLGREPLRPDRTPCGPAASAWTMPVPGEWLHFERPAT